MAGIHTVFAMLQDLVITLSYEESRPKLIIIYNTNDVLREVLIYKKYLYGVSYVIIQNYIRNMDKNRKSCDISPFPGSLKIYLDYATHLLRTYYLIHHT